MRLLVLTALLSLPFQSSAQDSLAGRWKTVDDATGKTKSIVEIHTARDGSIAGRVAEIVDTKDGPNPLCKECKGALHGKPIKGMTILWGLKPDGTGKWAGGRVLDPENGKDYRASFTPVDGGKKLEVRGYLGPFWRTQTWQRVE